MEPCIFVFNPQLAQLFLEDHLHISVGGAEEIGSGEYVCIVLCDHDDITVVMVAG